MVEVDSNQFQEFVATGEGGRSGRLNMPVVALIGSLFRNEFKA